MTARTQLLSALALALSSASPVAYADGTEWAGFTCGFTSTNDPTGVVQENPDVQFGEINGGPWTSYDLLADDNSGPSPHPGSSDITMHCWIQVNNPTPSHFPIASAHCDATGNGVAVLFCQITYTATSTDNVYLCTYVEMYHGSWYEHYGYDDDDDPTNGEQCALAVSAGQ